MTERERILAVLNHQKPDQLPWCADFAYLVHAMETDNIYPQAYINQVLDDGLQKMHRDYGTGFYLQGFSPYRAETKNVEINITQKNDITIRTITTPVGSLREVQQYSKSSYSTAIVEHLIKDIEDLKTFTYLCENTSYFAEYDIAQQRYKTIGDNGVVLCYTPKSPLMDLVALNAGVENVTFMEADDADEFAMLLDTIEDKYNQACKLVVESPAECIMIPENISSECVVPFYHKYMKRYHQKWTEQIRKAGKYSFVHLDGTVRGLITELSYDSQFDVIEAVTPYPVGDVKIEEVGGLVSPNTIIWGGIPGGMFREDSFGDKEFDEHVLRCIQTMIKSPAYVLGVADQVVPGSSIKRIKRVRELVNLYGQY